MHGLIIKKHWLDLIFSGEKTWEIRGHDCKRRDKIAFIESGTKTVVGTCEIVESFRTNPQHLEQNQHRTCITDQERDWLFAYRRPHAWVLSNAKRIEPVPYDHPKGAVIWVRDVLK